MRYKKSIFLILLTFLLAIFWLVPQKISASDVDYQMLSMWESKKIIEKYPEEIFNYWVNRKTSGEGSFLELTTLSLLKEIIRLDVWDYALNDLPLDVSYNVAKQSLELYKIIATGDVSGIIGKIEGESVKIAVEYLTDYFFENQVKASFGAIEAKYRTSFGKTNTVVQYIMTWKPIDDKKGKIVIRIYSPNKIIPPESYKGYGPIEGFSNELEHGEIIPPFVSEISGEMEKTSLNWIGKPKIDLVFSNNVPDFKIRPPSLVDRYMISPLQEKIKEVSGLIDVFGGTGEFVEIIVPGEQDQKGIDSEINSIDKEEKIVDIYHPEDIIIKEEETHKEIVCPRNNLSNPLRKIIINEVAWMGNKESSNNEWIELKNISKESINLKDWSLVDEADQINIIFEDIVISSGNFLLLERNNDNNVPLKKADVIYEGSLSNTNEKIYLFNNNCEVEDFVFASPDWPAGDNTEKRTMERDEDFSWHSYFGEGINGILGTPKTKNSIEIKKKEEIKEEVIIKEEIVVEEEEKIVSYCSQLGLSSPSHKDIIINEVAWMGGINSSNDEWIELKNISSKEINLEGWQLLDKENQIKVVFEEGDVILPGGFYLLERTDDNSLPNFSADKIYLGGLSNTNESLRLFDGNCVLIDEVLASPDWPGGDNVQRKTLERGDDLSWHTHSGSVTLGSPKSNNSQIIISGGGGISYSSVVFEETQYCSVSSDVPTYENIIINEVAWMGGIDSSNDEWIELKNISDEEVSLYGWELLSSNNQIKIVFEEGDVILPGGFYLLERTDDNSLPDINADKIYVGSLSNAEESLRLFNSDCVLIDEVLASPDWPAGDNLEKKTMERGDDLSWHTYFLDEGLGTPKRENSFKKEEEKIEEEEVKVDLVISEIQFNGLDNLEYIEIFNQGEKEVNLCRDEENCYYISYFPSTFDEEGKPKYNWNNPYYNWKFNKDETIQPMSYYLIVVYGNIEGNMVILNKEGNPYSSPILNNSNGSISLFYGNPVLEEVEKAELLKIDALNWMKEECDFEVPVKETMGIGLLSDEEKSLGRKLIEGKYKDDDNNSEDFELQPPSPGEQVKQSPEKIEEITFSLVEGHNNWIELSWQTPKDPDSLPEEINYEVYYSLNEEEMKPLSDYVDFEIKKEGDKNILIAKSLYYDKEYSFSIKAIDIDGNESELSEKFVFSTLKSSHLKDFIFGNYQKNNYFNFTGLEGEWGSSSLETILENHKNTVHQFLVDNDGIIYIGIGGEINALKEDNILWTYNCSLYCDVISLNNDGTIYFVDSYGLNALSPSGKLKWREPFGEISVDSIVKDYLDRIYFVAKNNDNYSLYTLEDSYSKATFSSIYENIYGGSNLVVDKNNNVYFSKLNTLIKVNYYLSQKEEMVFEVDYSEDYLGEKDKKANISKIIIADDGRVLVSIQDQFCDNNRCHMVLNLVSEDIKNIIWSKEDYNNPLAVGNNELYLWRNVSPPDNIWMRFSLSGVDLNSGEIVWEKRWASDISISHIDYLVTNNEGKIYFIQGNSFKGYDSHSISSVKPEDDIIAMVNLSEKPFLFSIINSRVMFSFQNKIMSLKY